MKLKFTYNHVRAARNSDKTVAEILGWNVVGNTPWGGDIYENPDNGKTYRVFHSDIDKGVLEMKRFNLKNK